MAGPLQAIGFVLLFASLSLLLPLLGLFSNAAIGLVTLRLGWQRGLFIATISSIILAGISLFTNDDALTDFALSMLNWLPMILLATLLGSTVSWKRTLTTLLAVAAMGIVLFHVSVDDPVKFWQSQPIWDQYLDLIQALQLIPDSMPTANREQILAQIAESMTSSLAITALLVLLISLIIARFWQSKLYNPGGFQREWHTLNLGKEPALAMMVIVGLALFSDQGWSTDLVLTGLAIFLFQGLALAHGLINQHQGNRRWLIAMYVLLALIPFYTSILLAAFGIIDGVANFRSLNKANEI